MNTPRVRFAPSPTGYLHIGSARTALFNWLYARAQAGKFILRIEDTDKKRSSDAYLKEILSDLEWLGLDWDEGPYCQSKRIALYKDYAEGLLKKGVAYKDGEAVIFKVPPERIKIYDIIHGEIEVDNSLIGELVIMKSDGTPTFNFACTVDDIGMKITHVIRGDDHISNTPKQFALYEALDAKPPKFAHIPLILGPDKAPLSKRFGAVSISEYREMGYLSDGLINYLALLGWAPGDNREFMERDEIVKRFSLKRVNKRGAEFDQDKLRWLNGEHIRKLDIDKFIETSSSFIKEKHDPEWFRKFSELYHGRVKTLVEFKEELDIFMSREVHYKEDAVQKFLKKEGVLGILKMARERLEKIVDFTPEGLEKECRALIEDLNIPSSDLIHPLRVAVTGKSVSAGIFEVLALLGKKKTLERLDALWRKNANL